MVQGGVGDDGLHDRPADQVRVGNLALAEQRPVVIDEAPVLVNDLDGNDSLRSRQRNGRADRHVLGDARGSSAQGHQFFGAGQYGFERGRHNSRGSSRESGSRHFRFRRGHCPPGPRYRSKRRYLGARDRKLLSNRHRRMPDRIDTAAAAHLRATHLCPFGGLDLLPYGGRL